MSLSTSILNSDDDKWVMGRLLSELQRLNARIDELEQDTLKKSAGLTDLPEPAQAINNITTNYAGNTSLAAITTLSVDWGSIPGKPTLIENDAGTYTVDDGTLSIEAGYDIIFRNPSAAASSNSGIGWAYSPTRYAAWTYVSGKVVFGDGVIGSALDGTTPIEYTPNATDASRLLNIDVALDLQGVSPTEGQAILADADGKPVWGDAPSGLPDTSAATSDQYVMWDDSANAWVLVGTIDVVLCVSGVTGTYRIPAVAL